MADITRLSRLLNGIQRQIALSENTLVIDNLKIKMGSGDNANHATFSPSAPLTGARTILMPDANVDLGDIALNSAARHDAVTLNADAPTQETLNLSGQDIQVNLATDSTAGAMSAADKLKLDGIEANAKDDQVAGEVPVTPAGGIVATDVQAALVELDGEVAAAQADATQGIADAAAAQSAIDAHLDGGANKHDADEIDYERADVARQDIQAGSDNVEAALSDLDDKKISADGLIAFGADQSMGGFKLTNLGAPVSGNDAARLSDVQAASAGQLPKAPADIVATSNITLSGEQTIDGVLTSASRVLVIGQTNAAENGIYVSAAGAWARADDADGNPDNEVALGNTVFILGGTAGANTVYILNGTNAANSADITVGTETQDWIIYSRAESTSASGGIQKVGLDFSLAASVAGSGISLVGGVLAIDFSEFNTDSLVEGSANLFYTEARFDSSFSGKSTSDLAEGSNLYFTDARAIAAPLTGFTSGAGPLSASDSILQAIQKLDGNLAAHEAQATGAHASSAISYDNSVSGLAATDVKAAIDEVEGRIDSLESGTVALTEDMPANEAYAANTLFAVRMAKAADAGFVAGRVSKADKDASSADNFYVIGLVRPGAAVSAGDSMAVYKQGLMPANAHGFTVGEPIYMDAAGALTQTAPSASDEAVVRVAIARDANNLEVQIQVMGIA
jgi:hypothetical protein